MRLRPRQKEIDEGREDIESFLASPKGWVFCLIAVVLMAISMALAIWDHL